MKSTILAVSLLSAATSTVLAQSAESSPYIPDSGISDNCRKFLVDLDSNAQLATCSNSLLTATSLFSPTGGASASDASSAEITSALRQLCATSSQCSNAVITKALTQFSGNCSAELSAGNQLVKSNYDVLYVLSPFTDAVCTKDATTNKYCALEIGDAPAPSTANSSSVSNATQQATQQLTVQTYKAPHLELSDLYVSMSQLAKRAVSNLVRRTVHAGAGGNAHGHNSLKARQANSSTAVTLGSSSSAGDANALLPNSTTFRQNNLAFLFLSGEMSSAQLCTSCTKNVLASYVAFENDFPYSIGLANSPILGGQVALWKDIGATCGSGFLSSITAQSGSNISSGASQSFVLSTGATLGAAALAALFFL